MNRWRSRRRIPLLAPLVGVLESRVSERCDAKSQRESILLVDLKDEGIVEEQVMRRERYPSVDRDRSRGSGAVGLCHATAVKSFTELSTFQVSAHAWRRVLCAVALSLRPAGLLLAAGNVCRFEQVRKYKYHQPDA